MAANAGQNRVPFIDVYEELTTNFQKKFLDYAKLVLDPTGGTFPTTTNVHPSGQHSKNGKHEMETEDGYPVMPEVARTDRKDDLEDLLRRYLTAQYSKCMPVGLRTSSQPYCQNLPQEGRKIESRSVQWKPM